MFSMVKDFDLDETNSLLSRAFVFDLLRAFVFDFNYKKTK